MVRQFMAKITLRLSHNKHTEVCIVKIQSKIVNMLFGLLPTLIFVLFSGQAIAGDTWITKASMPTARYALASSVVNGKIYAIGGIYGSSSGLSTIEEYDPVTDSWTTKTPMPTTRYDFTSSEVNGKIYAIGGYNGSLLTTVEEYDPATDSWSTKTSMPTARASNTSSEVNGRIYVIGGANYGGALTTVEEYDPATNSWSTKTSMPTARNYLTSSEVNGKIYVIGGAAGGGLNTVEEYTPPLANAPPVADAGPDQLVMIRNTVVQLNGSNSYDDDGDNFSFAWILSKPAGSTATLDDAAIATPSFVADVSGDYSAQLIVTDSNGAISAPDMVAISFDNIQPVANAGSNQNAVIGDLVSLDGSASSDVNLDSLSFNWSILSAPAGNTASLLTSNIAQSSFYPDAAGTYIIRLVVDDGLLNSLPADITVTVITVETAVTNALSDTSDTVNTIDPIVLKNPKMQNALTNKINSVLALIDDGDYQTAYDKLKNDILKKTDGCANSGVPDKNDWIQSCDEQGLVYPMVLDTLTILEGLI